MRAAIPALLILFICGCSQPEKKCEDAAECNDLNPCTDDSCDPKVGCLYENNTAQCDDGNACTLLDSCLGGICKSGIAIDCNNDNVCTDDNCDPVTGHCLYAHNDVPCNDQDACTYPDICQEGACLGVVLDICEDGNVCTDDSCDSTTGECVYTHNRDLCDDGDSCTHTDRCSDGFCEGVPYSCDDANACTNDSCNGDGTCSHENHSADCDDNNDCTVNDYCQDGECIAGTVICTQEVVVMIYLDGDNDLDASAMEDLAEMQAALVDDAEWLRVFALADRSPWSQWSDTRLYEIHNDDKTELDGPVLGITASGSLDELNMGDPATLSAFIQDVQAICGYGPSYFLILWNHGDGWRMRSPEDECKPAFKQVCHDETSDDWLSTKELHTALDGKELTLVGFDACLEGMVEVAYEIRNDAKIMVASEETEPVDGWDYHALLTQFMDTGNRSAVYFGAVTVDAFIDSARHDDVTLSVLDLTLMEPLAEGCNSAAKSLMRMSSNDFNSLCRSLDFFGGWWPEPHADLVQLFVKAKIHDSANAAAYDHARLLVEDAVLYERTGSTMSFANGLAVYFECEASVDPEYGADTIRWAADTTWDEMLRAH